MKSSKGNSLKLSVHGHDPKAIISDMGSGALAMVFFYFPTPHSPDDHNEQIGQSINGLDFLKKMKIL